MYFEPIGHSLHDFRGHSCYSSKSSLLDLIVLNDLGKAHISNLINPIVAQNILSFEVAMNDLVTMKLLNIIILTAMPLITCFKTSIASFSGMLIVFSISS